MSKISVPPRRRRSSGTIRAVEGLFSVTVCAGDKVSRVERLSERFAWELFARRAREAKPTDLIQLMKDDVILAKFG